LGDLVAEGNRYYDPANCYIGFHGDKERNVVIAVRLGESMPIHFQQYIGGEVIGKRTSIDLHHGDIYVMSERAVGKNWLKRNVITYRHAAGLLDVLYRKTKCDLAGE
jgi:hypothetical protein